MDYLTKWPAAIPITNKEAQIVAEALIDNWISCFGAPKILHLDYSTNSHSALIIELFRYLGV